MGGHGEQGGPPTRKAAQESHCPARDRALPTVVPGRAQGSLVAEVQQELTNTGDWPLAGRWGGAQNTSCTCRQPPSSRALGSPTSVFISIPPDFCASGKWSSLPTSPKT